MWFTKTSLFLFISFMTGLFQTVFILDTINEISDIQVNMIYCSDIWYWILLDTIITVFGISCIIMQNKLLIHIIIYNIISMIIIIMILSEFFLYNSCTNFWLSVLFKPVIYVRSSVALIQCVYIISFILGKLVNYCCNSNIEGIDYTEL